MAVSTNLLTMRTQAVSAPASTLRCVCDACSPHQDYRLGMYFVCVRTTLDARLTLVSHEIVGRLTLAVIARRRKAFVDSCITNIVAG